MLYISRYISRYSYGVVDTDDGKESVSSIIDIENAVLNYGLTIMGADTSEDALTHRCKLDCVHPYQHPMYTTSDILKAHTLLGIDITLWKGHITSITRRPWSRPVVIRLSDYADACFDRLFCRSPVSDSVLRVVLDDKISVTAHSFMRGVSLFSALGIEFDVREVTIQESLNNVYLAAGLVDARNVIVDDEKRKERMIGAMRGRELVSRSGTRRSVLKNAMR